MQKKLLEHVFLVHWNCRQQTLYVKFNCCPSERNLSLSKRCRAGKQEAYQIVIKTNFCISSWAFWLTVVCHMKNIIIKIFLVFCRFGADTTTKRRLLLQTKWVGTIISTLTTNTWFVITTHTQLSQQLIHRCGYTFGGGGNARSCLPLYTAADFQSSWSTNSTIEFHRYISSQRYIHSTTLTFVIPH